MAGRGRGRGRGNPMAFTAEVLGLGRGDMLPSPSSQVPPPIFPPLQFRPVPLSTGDEWDYMLLLKQEFRSTMRDSPYYIKPQEKKKDIVRYSDKYRMSTHTDHTIDWVPDWKRLPKELRIRVRKPGSVNKASVKPNLKAAKSVSKKEVEVVTKKLAELEKKETDAASGDENKDEEAEEELDEEEYYDEEEQEEGTDYIVSYFDNGEDNADDEEDNLDDGPVY